MLFSLLISEGGMSHYGDILLIHISTKYETCGGLIMLQMLRCDLIMLHVHINS